MRKSEQGFSLVEVAITLGIVSLILVSLIGLISPIQDGVRVGNLADSASRLEAVVNEKLNASDDALGPALASDSALVIAYLVRVKPDFSYAADPKQSDLHLSFENGINGGYRLAPVARRAWVPEEIALWKEDATAIEGAAFLVRLRLETEVRLQPDLLTEHSPPETRILTCSWHELPVGLPQDQWDAIFDRDVILKTPLVIRP